MDLPDTAKSLDSGILSFIEPLHHYHRLTPLYSLATQPAGCRFISLQRYFPLHGRDAGASKSHSWTLCIYTLSLFLFLPF